MTFVAMMIICCTVVLYAMAVVLYIYQLKTRTEKDPGLPLFFAGSGLVFQAVLIAVNASENAGIQLSGANILMIASWIIMAVYILFEMVSKRRSYGAFITPIVLVAMILSWLLGAGDSPTMGMDAYAPWPLLTIHVVAYFVSAAIFLFGGISAVMYLYQENLLKTKKKDAVGVHMPGLSFLKKVMRRSAVIGLPVLLLAMLLGISRAINLGIFWLASPRVILALIVFVIYCIIAIEAYVIRSSSNTIAKTHLVGSAFVIILIVSSAILPML